MDFYILFYEKKTDHFCENGFGYASVLYLKLTYYSDFMANKATRLIAMEFLNDLHELLKPN